jgi:hypothetical protein
LELTDGFPAAPADYTVASRPYRASLLQRDGQREARHGSSTLAKMEIPMQEAATIFFKKIPAAGD